MPEPARPDDATPRTDWAEILMFAAPIAAPIIGLIAGIIDGLLRP